jgi:CheY-like chemotaxis protein
MIPLPMPNAALATCTIPKPSSSSQFCSTDSPDVERTRHSKPFRQIVIEHAMFALDLVQRQCPGGNRLGSVGTIFIKWGSSNSSIKSQSPVNKSRRMVRDLFTRSRLMPHAMKLIADRMPRADTRILICEDDPLIALGWAAFLADEGYTVVGPAYKAEKALELAYQDLPALALIDIDLGGIIDGISVAAELAPLGVSVIFVTADYQRAGLEGRELAADILIKPVGESVVLHAIASSLHRKREANAGKSALSA